MNAAHNGNKAVILFDGVCNLCNAAVQTVIRNDRNDYFRFASLQSEQGRALLQQYRIAMPSGPESVVLIQDGRAYKYATAALKIARRLSGGYSLLYAFIVVPAFLRNAVYKWIARNRYRWWGKQESCWLPSPELKSKFL